LKGPQTLKHKSSKSSAINRAPSGRSLKRGSTRGRIVRSATHLFATLGFANTSISAIAHRSSITPGAIYRHFDSKAELLLEVVRYALETLPMGVRLFHPVRIEAFELPEFVASYASPGYELIRHLSLEIHLAASRQRDVDRLLTKVRKEATSAICRSIRNVQESGMSDTTVNPDFIARFVLVMIMGLSHMGTLEPFLIGDSAWHNFISERISVMLGFHKEAAVAHSRELSRSKQSQRTHSVTGY